MNELTLTLDISGRDADEVEGKAYALVRATMRLLPARPEVTMCLGEENSYEFTGDEDSLRLLYALAEAKQVTCVIDTFEEACGIEDTARTRVSHLAMHRA